MIIFRMPRTILTDGVNFIKKKKNGNLGICDLIFDKKNTSKETFTHNK